VGWGTRGFVALSEEDKKCPVSYPALLAKLQIFVHPCIGPFSSECVSVTRCRFVMF
jgi:hypothetical protein